VVEDENQDGGPKRCTYIKDGEGEESQDAGSWQKQKMALVVGRREFGARGYWEKSSADQWEAMFLACGSGEDMHA
jgi:hypothetical protein